MDYFYQTKKKKASRGDLLISEPFLEDLNFERTVILLCEVNEDGAFGLVLNKYSGFKLQEAIQKIKIEDFDAKIFVGGPVEHDTMHFIHRVEGIEGAITVKEGIYWGGHFEQLVSKIEAKEIEVDDVKFFVGYSGWGENQLEEELKEKAWMLVGNVNQDMLFKQDPNNMWREILEEMGGTFKMMSKYPTDPRNN